ncbi:MAG: hypothetical protein ACLGI6_10575 [Gammaproteobacteria bacterium]
MDNQKSNEGNARNVGSEGSGNSLGKDLGGSRSGGATGGSSIDNVTNKAKDLANEAVNKAPEAHKAIDQAAEAAQPVVDRLASSAHASVDKVTNLLSGAGGTIDEKKRQLTDAYQNFASSGRDYVRTSPGTSLLVAGAIGFVLAKLLGGRSRY